VLRKDGTWSRGSVTKVLANIITVTLENGAYKDIPADSAHSQVKLLNDVKHLSPGQAVLVKRSSGSWTIGVVTEERSEAFVVALEDGSYKEVSRDGVHKQVQPFQWSQTMKPAVQPDLAQQGYADSLSYSDSQAETDIALAEQHAMLLRHAEADIALASNIVEGERRPQECSSDESEADPFTTALKETLPPPKETPPPPKETPPQEQGAMHEETERVLRDSEAVPDTQLVVQDMASTRRIGRILATGQIGEILVYDPSDVDLAWKLRVGDKDDWFPAHAVEEITGS
jgi:hypothetical protein